MVGYACRPTESLEFYGKIAFRVKPVYAPPRLLLPLAAPTHYTTRFRLAARIFTRNSEGLAKSSIACQEAIGLIWYRLRLM
jgi:hypothetical protein